MSVTVEVRGMTSDAWETWAAQTEQFVFATDEEAVAEADKVVAEWERWGMFDYATWDYA